MERLSILANGVISKILLWMLHETTARLSHKNESCSHALRQQALGIGSCNSCPMGEAMGTRSTLSFAEVGCLEYFHRLIYSSAGRFSIVSVLISSLRPNFVSFLQLLEVTSYKNPCNSKKIRYTWRTLPE